MGGLDLRGNSIGGAGCATIIAAVCSNTDSKVHSISFGGYGIGPTDAIVIGEALRTSVCASLTSCDLSSNNLAGGKYVKETNLPGSDYKSGTKVIYEGQELTVLMEKDSNGNVWLGTLDGVAALADALRTSASLIKVDLKYNGLNAEADAAIKEAVSGKEGFELLI